jgi:hypothetical protein
MRTLAPWGRLFGRLGDPLWEPFGETGDWAPSLVTAARW